MVKSLPSNAGDVGSIPSQGTKIPHATGQLKPARSRACAPQLESLCASTTELMCSAALTPQLERRPHAATREPARSGDCVLQLERSLRAASREAGAPERRILCAAAKTRHSQIITK